MSETFQNRLFCGDNLEILREYIPDASVDLIYLDPPFNSNRNYNVLFRDESGIEADAQIIAFEDTWHWDRNARNTYENLLTETPDRISRMIEALRTIIGANQMMAYLVMMTARLLELHRVLKPTGSLYLHCDATASHYLRIVLDTIFGVKNFRGQIIWKRTTGRSHTNKPMKRWGEMTDFILHYARSEAAPLQPVYRRNDPNYIEKFFRHIDDKGRRYRIDNLASPSKRPNLMYEYKGYKPPENGWAISKAVMEQWDKEERLHFPKSKSGRIQRKRYLDELAGEVVQNLWDDIPPVSAHAAERTGYPTQKPLALLERIIAASSQPGDLVLDPFCGCGTAIVAAQQLGRRWIGIDITHLAIAMNRFRLHDRFDNAVQYEVVRVPKDLPTARELAKADRYQFQWWALSLIKARPAGGELDSKKGKKGADSGIDGTLVFVDDADEKAKRVVIQVKSGAVKVGDIRDLKGVLEREKAAIAIFITLEPPTAPMRQEALEAGSYYSVGMNKRYPRLQILTIEELLEGTVPELPPSNITFKRDRRAPINGDQQPLV